MYSESFIQMIIHFYIIINNNLQKVLLLFCQTNSYLEVLIDRHNVEYKVSFRPFEQLYILKLTLSVFGLMTDVLHSNL